MRLVHTRHIIVHLHHIVVKPLLLGRHIGGVLILEILHLIVNVVHHAHGV